MPKTAGKLSVGFLFDDTLDSNDGVAQQVKRLGEWFGSHGHKVVYLCGETKLDRWAGGKVYSLARNISVRFNGNRLTIPLLASGWRIGRVLDEEKLDILHVQMPYSPILSQRVINRGYKSSAVVGTFHILPSGLLSSLGCRILGAVQWFSLKKMDETISVSQAAAEFAGRIMGIHSRVIPNMVELAKFSGSGAKPIPGRIVFLGRLVGRKGCEQLIRAFAIVVQTNSLAELVIAGDGEQRRFLEGLVKRLDLDQKVTFLGFIDEDDKPRILAEASVACFPSLHGESFGIVLIEAMAAGAGVVLAGDNPGYRSVMGKRPELLIDPRDAKAFASRLNQLLRDQDQVKMLHQWQNEHVKSYDVDIVCRQILAVYETAIAKKTKTIDN